MEDIYNKVHPSSQKKVLTHSKKLGSYNGSIVKRLGHYNKPVIKRLGYYN